MKAVRALQRAGNCAASGERSEGSLGADKPHTFPITRGQPGDGIAPDHVNPDVACLGS